MKNKFKSFLNTTIFSKKGLTWLSLLIMNVFLFSRICKEFNVSLNILGLYLINLLGQLIALGIIAFEKITVSYKKGN